MPRELSPSKLPYPVWLRVILALLGSLAALWLQMMLEPYLGLVLFLALYPVVFLAAWLGGTAAALTALVACLLGVDYLFIEPRGSIGMYDRTSLTRMAFFVFNNTLVIWLVRRSRLAESLARAYLAEAKENGLRYIFAGRATQDAIWDWNLQTNEVHWNESIRTAYGYSEDARFGPSSWWTEHIHPQDRDEIVHDIHRVIESGGEHWQAEYRFRRSDGSYAEVLDRGFVVRDAAGKALRMVGAMQDITARKKAERELQKYKRLIDSSADFIGMADPQDGVLFVNKAGREMVGLAPDANVANLMPGDLVAEEYRALMELEVFPVTLAQGQWNGEFRLRNVRSGEGIPVLLNSFTVMDSEVGGRVLFAGVSRDIREQKAVEERYRQLAESLVKEQERFGRVALAVDLGVWFCDLPFDKLIWSDKVKQHFWMPPSAEVRIQDFYGQIHPEDVERVRGAIEQSIGDHSIYDVQFRTVPDASSTAVKFIRAVGWTDYDAIGTPVRFDGITLDVTEMVQREKELREAVTTRDDFLSMASHELKTPLTSMKLQAQLVGRAVDTKGTVAPEQLHHVTKQLDKQISRITRLVDDMLDISRIQAGKLWVRPERVDLTQLARETAERLEGQFAEESLPPPVLRSSVPLWAEVDALKIEQVLVNLLTNARRYGGKDAVEISLEALEERVQIRVRDYGPGVPVELRDKIFERFERATPGNAVSGLGLGLYISREIVRAHGGSIAVENAERGAGAVFTVDLPLKSIFQGA